MIENNLRRGAGTPRLSVPLLLALAAVLAGCAVGPTYLKPDTAVAPKFAGAGGGPYSSEDAQGKFWT